jgi:hypothetical protein
MVPSDKKLYDQVKKEADAKFLAPTSVYKSAWIVREYKKRNGTFEDSKDENKGLLRWFKEKWVDLNRPGEACGRKSSKDSSTKYPLCRPTIKVTKDTPKLAQEIDARTIQLANKGKQRIREAGRVRFGKDVVVTIRKSLVMREKS